MYVIKHGDLYLQRVPTMFRAPSWSALQERAVRFAERNQALLTLVGENEYRLDAAARIVRLAHPATGGKS
jgi:hypothetical protein